MSDDKENTKNTADTPKGKDEEKPKGKKEDIPKGKKEDTLKGNDDVTPKGNNEDIPKSKNEEQSKFKKKDAPKGKHVSSSSNEENSAKSKQEKRQEKRKKKLRNKKIRRISIIVASSIACVYLLGLLLFSFVCYPNTVVADTNLSFQTESAVHNSLEKSAGEYVLTVDGLDFDFELNGESIDYEFDLDTVTQRVMELKHPFIWPYEIFIDHRFISDSVVQYNKEKAEAIVIPAINDHNSVAVKPQNAAFVCDPITKTVSVKNEVIGNYINLEKGSAAIFSRVNSASRSLTLSEDEQLLPSLYANDERISPAVEAANKMYKSVLTLKMASVNVGVVDASLLTSWITLKEGYVTGLNDDLVSAWVADLAFKYNTLGKARTYTAPFGKTCTVSGGDGLGWEIDEAALVVTINQQVATGAVTAVDVPCSSTFNAYTGPGGADWGTRYIDVDLSSQTARFYDANGSVIWSAAFVSGKPATPTPTGIYTVKRKASPSVLHGAADPVNGTAAYDTEVQYWMPFVGNAIGFHDANWQSSFGGSRWTVAGSHGCLNLSTGSAASLYGLISVGDVVVVHN